MSDHNPAWIAAYYDGELNESERRKVEAHLQTCAACQSELEALQALSVRLQEAPVPPERTPAERFVSQVRLRIGDQPVRPLWQRMARTGWWVAPAGIIGLWAFGQAVLLVSGWMLTLLPVLERPLGTGSLLRATAWWQVDQGLALIFVLELLLSLMTTALLGGWLASWWAARRQDFHTQAED